MSESRKQAVQEAVKQAMKAGEKARLTVLRGASAAIKQREVDERVDLGQDDDAVIETLSRMIKQRRESAAQYRDAGEAERAETEEWEIAILSEFLPEAASDDEIRELLEAAIQESGASSIRDMGRVMAILKPRLQGRADLGAVSAQVKERLNAQ